MCTTRRTFLEAAGLGGLGWIVLSIVPFEKAVARNVASLPTDATGDCIAASVSSFYRSYQSKSSENADVVTWMQVDLGSSQFIDAVKIYPANKLFSAGTGFPSRFRIECSDDPTFRSAQMIADRSRADYQDPGNRVVRFPANGAKGRYVRLTANRLSPKKPSTMLAYLPPPVRELVEQSSRTIHFLALSKMEILSNGVDIGVRRPVVVDSTYGSPEDSAQITRPPRPQGEGIITDNPHNVVPHERWRPAHFRVQAPVAGVELKDGLFKSALTNNIHYLLDTFTVDDMLRPFRERAGITPPPSSRTPNPFWEGALPGSNAGRFLMGAGTTLHWVEDAELRKRLNAVVAGIAACRQSNGYIMGYPEDTFFVSERGAYTRSWTTHGLLEAGYSGNPSAFQLLRGYYDWYNKRPYLPEMLRGCNQGGQGMVANTRVYFSPVGRPADIHVLQQHFQENFWLEDLAARRVDAVWQYPYDRPHCYLLTNLEAYLDLYRATGEGRYLDAVLGGWELFRDNWQNVGGSISLIELQNNLPRSNPLYEALGETCGSVFWILINQRLHLLDPQNERYVAQIEKSIYNVLLANQADRRGFRYHSVLMGQKEKPACENTCCEGQGSRLVGMLPQFIFSNSEDVIHVDLFAPATLTWECSGEILRLEMDTNFPYGCDVRLNLRTSRPIRTKISVRIPCWASSVMNIAVNGGQTAAGMAGSYVTLDRLWSEGDVISFTLPMSLKLTKYEGVDQIEGRERYWLEYGPILMAAVATDSEIVLYGAGSSAELVSRLQPVKERPLHFVLPTYPSIVEFAPYFEIGTEYFSCVPLVVAKPLPIDS